MEKSEMKDRAIKQIPVILIFIALSIILSACGPKKAGSITNVSSPPADSTYIFDGKSLNGWEITNFGTQGQVTVSDGEIILGMGDGCTGITWKRDFPSLNYEVTLDARKVDGNDFFCGMTFPVGKYPCTLIVGGWGGTTVGLSSINGLDASENETTTLRKFDKDRWYRIKLDVTGEAIIAWIDDEKVVDFTIGDNILSIRPEVELSRPFGIASWKTTAALRNIRVVRLER
jgi:3-keto-disaccharide hydrolase